MTKSVKQFKRCKWLTKDEFYIKYHDDEWGRPVRDNRKLFEMLCLEGQQAGLSWRTILSKRDNFRKAFFNFDPHKVATMSEEDVEKLIKNSGIIRQKAKIKSVINNAKAYIKLESEGKDFSEYIWSFVDNKPVLNCWKENEDIPSETETSQRMAKSLKKFGFTFVGSKVCYVFMQACGLVNDHIIDCCARDVDKMVINET